MARSIHIRDVPDEVYEALCSRATAAEQSLSDYLLAEITRLAAHTPIADVLQRAAGRSGGATTEAIVETVRSGRDRP